MDAQTRLAWLESRRKGIGGSDAAAILGIDPWKGPYSVYQSKVSPIGEQKPQMNDAMYWGNALEQIVADEFENRSGFVLWSDTRLMNAHGEYPLITHPGHPWMHASIDRWLCTTCPSYADHLLIDHKADSFLECKTAREGKQKEWDEGVPENYYAQVQHYLAVTGFDYCFVACLVGGSTYITHKIERNAGYIMNLISREMDFWFNRVVAQSPPPPDDSEATTSLLNGIEATGGKPIELPPYRTFGILHELKEVKDSITTLEKAKMRLENELKVSLGDAELGFVDGRCVVTWKTQSRAGIDSTRLWEQWPDVAKQVTKESKFRVLRVQEIESGG